MAHYSTYSLSADNEQSTLTAAERERTRNDAAPAHTAQPQVTQGGRKVQVDVGGDGKQVVRESKVNQASIAWGVRPGNIVIPGVGETTIEAAKAAGFLPPGFQEAGPNTVAAPAGTQTNTEASQDEAPKAAPDATDTAGEVLGSLVTKMGVDTVENSLLHAAETGELENSIPEGVTDEQVSSVVEGFVLQANNALRSVSASVDLLNEVCNEEELREARMATIHNDREKLQHFGKLAAARLEAMPYQNAQAFESLIEGMPAAERKALTKDEASGEWIVTTKRGRMSFGEAVRQGIVRVG